MINKNIFRCLILGIFGLSFFTLSLRAQQPNWTKIVTSSVGLDSVKAFSLFVTDLNNDFYPDIVVVKKWYANNPNNMRSYMNVPDTNSSDPKARMFVEITDGSGLNSMPDPSAASKGTIVAAFADINNDGNIDMVRGSFHHADATAAPDARSEVLLGDGKGNFKIVPNNGLHELGQSNITGFSFLDYDKDGHIDLFIARWFVDYNNNKWQTGLLMRGNGDGTFTDVTASAGITKAEPMYGCAVVDWNNDGWPDIATAPYCRTGGQLWKNNGDGTFTDVAASIGYNGQFMQGDGGQALCMFGSAAEDFDNDGDMDFIFSLVHGGNDPNEGHSTLVVNKGAAEGYKLAWDLNRITWKSPKSTHQGDYDATWLDIDNDGLIDIALAQGTYKPATDRMFVFHQKSDHSFMDITQDIGLLVPAAKDMHHVAALDYDLDGDDDLLMATVGLNSPLNLVENTIGQDNNWLGVRLDAPSNVNKSSVGARIYLWSGGVQRMREVYAGRGNNGGQQPFALLFGIGKNEKIDSVKVVWPNKQSHYTKITNPKINQYINIGPGVDGVTSIERVAKTTELAGLKVYPNPAEEFILVQFENNAPIDKVEVYNLLGQRVLTKSFTDGNSTQYCSIADLAPGNYILKATNNKSQTIKTAIVKL